MTDAGDLNLSLTPLAVVVTTPAYSGLGPALTYVHDRPLEPGTLVRVPLGKRELLGLVWEAPGLSLDGLEPGQARAVLQVFDAIPPLNAAWRGLASFAARYYQRSLGEVALSEALLLQIALIKAVSEDEDEQKRRTEALIKRYQAISAEREAKLAQRSDPNFERYKIEEKNIVEEVLGLQNIPEGLTRDQYLRQRLQEARERNYQQAPDS